MGERAIQVKRRGVAILSLCREIEEVPSESTFMLVECGLHSGFPRCCIIFFVTAYAPLGFADHLRTKERRAFEHYKKLNRDRGMDGYIACPQCLIKRTVVRVKPCDWHLTARERRGILANV